MGELAVIVLAAGMGTRMKSAVPKVLHKIGGRTLLGHVLKTAQSLSPQKSVVVVGPNMSQVAEEAQRMLPGSLIVEQTERLGTAHAVSMAKASLAGFSGTILVLYGDCPLVKASSLQQLIGQLDTESTAAVLAFEAHDPHGYGRIIQAGGGYVAAIREELDASPDERRIRICNSGILAFDSGLMWKQLSRVRNDNKKGEFYLTDLVELSAQSGAKVGLTVCGGEEVAGVNDRVQLAALEARFQAGSRQAAMLGGTTLIDPQTVHFAADTEIGRDIVIEPNVFFGPGVVVEDNVTIAANSHIEGARIGRGSRIGPFARLRPGADLGPSCHIGNFVEIKQATVGEGAKINHLSYIGNASVGAGTNIGAGAITCNYDGFDKHKTEIGANVFVGSNTAIVAPARVGNGANIAAGSVITQDVPADALAIARSDQSNKEGWAKRYRELKQARKAARKK